MTNKLIAFEGIDGSGKSTRIKKLAEKIKGNGEDVYTTFEPTDNYIGKLIRDVFSYRYEASQETIAGLFVADRLDHLLHPEHGMLKMLETKHVLTDRYYFSSYAYHGVHVDMTWVMEANRMAVSKGKADLHIFIDVNPEICLKRIHNNRTHIEMYETLDNLIRVRNQYLLAFDQMKDRENIMMVDGNRSEDEIAEEIWSLFKNME
ncbi:MAG: dTMP kinase [Saprospiraceae bacterium]|nr:dTMP kinase [Saprospiraceae bacterium]